MASTEPTYRLFINGEWTDGNGEGHLTVVNPATEEVIARVPEAGIEDLEAAVTAARVAFDEGPWPRMRPKERAKIMSRMGEIMHRRRAELVDLNMREAGSVRGLAEAHQTDAPIAHWDDITDRIIGSYRFVEPLLPVVRSGPKGMIGQGVVLREPIGVAALITPYNFPFFLNVCKLAPALATGCTTVLKPSPDTPLEALVLGEIAAEAGLPPGVLNVVTGDVAVSRALTTHPMVDLVSFTGSAAIGRQVYTQAAQSLKRVVLELGGKSANLIFEDADLERAAASVVDSFTVHAGQGCALLTRTLVHRNVKDELLARVRDLAARIRVGDPADPATTMGPVISASQRERIERDINSGIESGASLVFGGARPANLDRGYFVEPTLFTDVRNSMPIAREEIFGPVGVVLEFSDQEEAIRMANDSDYGLSGGVWSQDLSRAYEVGARLRTGTVHVNGGGGLSPYPPFGGYKHSGIGVERGEYGLQEYVLLKHVGWGVR
ncbi:aldehyde dehydrogenase family protein [Dactylosporangium sp. NPDC051484]|uniref:aldehyde dehydrogenase family protein n=1 Tax=Dactylosporangium sp. NPDC051484 TaxID=3154942 RepID=UPI00344B59F2